MDIDLTPFFTTKVQANDFSNRLESIAESLYKTNFNFEKELHEQFGIQKKDTFMVLLQEHKIAVDNASALKIFLTKIRETIAGLHTLSMTMAIEPNDVILKTIAEWFPLQLNRQVVIDVSVNPELIAGATISYRGKYLDNSIKKIFRQVVNDIVAREHGDQLKNMQGNQNVSQSMQP